MDKAVRKNHFGIKISLLAVFVILAGILYLSVDVNPKYVEYAMKLRVPKLVVMLITAFCIGSASIVFQSIINNTIVTPCLLGMNSLYLLIHTAVVFFFGSGSVLARNAQLSFLMDLVLMGVTATIIYSYLFRKTKHNVLYVLLAGTVMTTFFSSMQTTLTRVMDPNEYDSLLTTLVASFSNVNSEIILISVILIAVLVAALRKELALLDVMTLGKDQAINLGVDYDRTIRRLLLGVAFLIAIATAMVGPSFISSSDHCQPVQTAISDLSPQLADRRIFSDRYGSAGRRTASGGTYFCIQCAGQCVYYRWRRNLFPLFTAAAKGGFKSCRYEV